MTEQLIETTIENDNSIHLVKQGSSLTEILDLCQLKLSTQIIAAFTNNHLKELSYRIFTPKSIRFVEFNSSEGRRVYSRSLFLLLSKVVKELIADDKVKMMHPVGRGYYCEFINCKNPSEKTIAQIRQRMNEVINDNIPIIRHKISLKDAISQCQKEGRTDKLLLLKTRPVFYVSVFDLDGYQDFHHTTMVPSTGYLKVFDITKYHNGIVVHIPNRENPSITEYAQTQPKLQEVFREYKHWQEIINVENIGSLNQNIINHNAGDLIKISEALQENNFSVLANNIYDKFNSGVRIILLAGPSSSGKTTASKRIAIQLKVLGLNPKLISLDNYFVNREDTPLDENGEYDFETLKAIDLPRFNDDLKQLIDKKEINIPKFNFKLGRREQGKTLQLDNSSILVIEGIHGLNPSLIYKLNRNVVYKVYVSALTTLSIDNSVAIHTTDNRLIRRIVRDNKYRGRSAYETLRGWGSVRRGEDLHIFPYQEEADAILNTALIYELSVLAPIVKPLLNAVPETEPEYSEALRLIKFLNYFLELNTSEIPPTSILKEFIGGSSFEY